jgi:hypothetical protein
MIGFFIIFSFTLNYLSNRYRMKKYNEEIERVKKGFDKEVRDLVARYEKHLEKIVDEKVEEIMPAIVARLINERVQPVLDEIREVNRMVGYFATDVPWSTSKMASIRMRVDSDFEATTVNIGDEEFVFKMPVIQAMVDMLLITFTRPARN